MKKMLLLFFITFSFCDVSNIVFKIKEVENSKKIFLKYPLYNIFITKQTNNIQRKIIQQSTSIDMKIYAIFNNKVNINGQWKRKGEYINEYKIIRIFPNYIVLKKDNKIKLLRIQSNIIKVSK